MAFGAVSSARGAACSYPDFVFDGTGAMGGNGAGAGGEASTSSSGLGAGSSSIASSSSSSHSSSSSSSGSTCDVQHPAGGTCEYLPKIACGCTGTKKCSVVDDATGVSGCVFAGSTPDFGRCTSDNDCKKGSWCNHATSACQPICIQNADCVSGGQCLPALQSGKTTPIPDLKVCTAHCDLVTAVPCTGGLTCVSLDSIKEFDCYDSLNVKKDEFCSADTDCAPGLWCSNNSLTCIPWCAPATSSGPLGSAGCSSGEGCYSFSPPIKSGTREFGFCL